MRTLSLAEGVPTSTSSKNEGGHLLVFDHRIVRSSCRRVQGLAARWLKPSSGRVRIDAGRPGHQRIAQPAVRWRCRTLNDALRHGRQAVEDVVGVEARGDDVGFSGFARTRSFLSFG